MLLENYRMKILGRWIVATIIMVALSGCGHSHSRTYYIDNNATGASSMIDNFESDGVRYLEIEALNIKTSEVFDAGFVRVTTFRNNEKKYEIILPSSVKALNDADIRYRIKNNSELFKTKHDLVESL